jgi:hypothetical protein
MHIKAWPHCVRAGIKFTNMPYTYSHTLRCQQLYATLYQQLYTPRMRHASTARAMTVGESAVALRSDFNYVKLTVTSKATFLITFLKAIYH